MNEVVRFAPVLWPLDAERLGFAADESGERIRNGSALRSEGSWLALELRQPYAAPTPPNLLGTPGLWRPLRKRQLPHQPTWVPVFDLPPLLSPEAQHPDETQHPCAALLDWAEATVDGSPPSDWAPPARAEVEEWIEPRRRSVRAGAYVAQVDLVVDPMRFALEISPLVRIPAELPDARAAWLEELCQDVQQRWRMVRFGVDEAAASVRAEIDLTGAPSERARPLVELGLSALTCSAAWALPSFSTVANPAVRSQLLDHKPRWDSSRLTTEGTTQ
jgi:hypothetical protein